MDSSLIDYLEYIKENAVGLLLFVLVFVIIYCVDHINRINSLIFSSPSAIPGVPTAIPNQLQQIIPKIKAKRSKKH